MFCFRSNPLFLLLLPLILVISEAFASEGSHVHHRRPVRVPEPVDFDGGDVEVVWGATRRSVAETVPNSTLLLAEKRTYRRDPIDGFKHYTGGWNISQKHYWASVGFTAAPLFIIGGIWLILFGLSLLLICCCYCCCRKEPYGYSRMAYALSLILLILFTIAAIAGCVVLYIGQGKFHNSTTNTLDYVVNQANTTGEKLRDVSEYLSAAKRVGVDQVFLPSDVQTNINNIQSKIDSSATALGSKTQDNSKRIRHLLNSVRLALIIVAAVMLLLAFLGFVFSILGLRGLVYFLVIIGWILVAATFILSGIFVILHNAVADTCVAMDEWVQNPTAHTALDDILPCVDNATAQETLVRSKDVTFRLVSVVNTVITNISNVNIPPSVGPPLYFNQSGPLMPVLCNPFNSDLTNRHCVTGEVDFNNATQVWKSYICQVSSSGLCTTAGRVTPSIYNQMMAGVNVSYGLYNYGPFLVSLQDCSFARQTFNDIYNNHCPGLRRYSKWVYIGLTLVSSAVMLSLIFWVIYARERRHRVYTKQFDRDKAPY